MTAPRDERTKYGPGGIWGLVRRDPPLMETRLESWLRLTGSSAVPQIPQIWSWLLASERVSGFTAGEEAIALGATAYGLPPPATIVEIGSFVGRSSILLAAALRARGRGGVCHCIDPFDGSGDTFSRTQYHNQSRASGPLLDQFQRNISAAGLTDFVQVHVGRAEELGLVWNTPIDLLYMDGDQSPEGVRAAWDLFSPHLASHGIVALHNAELTNHRTGHDGHRILAEQELLKPRFGDRRWVGTTCFAYR